jgi:ketosteroid isomerase-like protein
VKGETVVESGDPIENDSKFMRATVKTLFGAVSVADGEALRPLLADDAIMELPFAIPPFPSAKSGGDAIASGIKGGIYSNQYVFIFKFANDKIILWKEYFNPLRLPDLSS